MNNLSEGRSFFISSIVPLTAAPRPPSKSQTMKEASARIKINQFLEKAGWRFFADAKGPANIMLEANVSLKS